MLANTYYVCLFKRNKVVRWDPFSFDRDDYPDFLEINYLAGAFRELERNSSVTGLTFYITWDVHELPSYGDDIVVFLLGDEWCRVPAYLDKIRVLFREHSNHPMFTGDWSAGFTYLNSVSLAQFLRLHFIGLSGRLNFFVKRLFTLFSKRLRLAQTHLIPLGYAFQLALPIKPLADRSADIFFKGSVLNLIPRKYSLKYFLRAPKNIAREQMLIHAKSLQSKRPDLSIELEETEQFTGNVIKDKKSIENEAAKYSAKMMDAKVSLVPRGSSLETFRLFEAVRYGCIVVANRLPQRWFYDGAPIIQVKDWRELERTIEDLFNNFERLEILHQASLDYWHSHCSEKALGIFIGQKLMEEA